MKANTLFLLGWLALAGQAAVGQGTTAFTYQGRLDVISGPANGLYDFRCQLYDAEITGALVSTTVTNTPVRVTNGLFVLNLDFGASVFDGAPRWLSIDVRTNNGLNFDHVSPRQRLAPAPYAIYAGTAGSLAEEVSQTFSGTVTFNPVSGPPFSVANPLKVPNLNADLLDGLDSTAWVLKAGDTMTGNLTIANAATLNFGSSVRQMINLWGTAYGIGVQAASLYFRSDDGFAWFRDGAHAVGTFDPGPGGAALMTLSADGNLTVTSPTRASAIRGDATGAIAGIGVQGLAGRPLVSQFAFAPAWGVQGSAPETNSGGVFGEAAAQTSRTWGVLGRAHSASGYGVAGENDSALGIGVYGVHGLIASGGNTTRCGVYGESTEDGGNGVVGVANSGASAYGVWGKSTSGMGGVFDGATYGVRAVSTDGSALYGSSVNGLAGQFAGAVRIDGHSSHGKPFLQLHETEDGDYARIMLQVANRPLWHLSVGGVDNSLVFYNSANSIVTSVSETGVLTTKVLTITGGADIAEPFKMSETNLPRGAVVVIDEQNPGQLKLSTRAYDTRVAGIISGAGGVNPGLSLSQHGVVGGDQHVALTGRVYVRADALENAINPGDLLTTSDAPGHAMKVTEHARAQGAILGKAMTGLKTGRGLVLVLVTLQ
jgi:hypothetical protein